MAAAIRITVNGEPREARSGETVLDLLKRLEIDPERVAVEPRPQKIVRAAAVASATALRDGAEMEIVQFVGGG